LALRRTTLTISTERPLSASDRARLSDARTVPPMPHACSTTMRTSRPSAVPPPRRRAASLSASRCTRIAGGPSTRRASPGLVSSSAGGPAGASGPPASERTETLFSSV
jgi:hypothetical protein